MGISAEDADRAAVQQVLAGDVEAFESIVRRWQGRLVNLAYRYCRDSGRAEETAQEAFLRVFRFLGRWHQDAAFSTWLFAVATNVYRSQLRRLPLAEVPIDGQLEIRDDSDPSIGFEKQQRAEVVRGFVSRLPAKYRDAILLFYFQEMNIAQAAGSLGIREGTLKARLHRARELLGRRLAGTLRDGTGVEVL